MFGVQTPEKQFSDTITPQQGVEDTSATTKMQGNINALKSVTDTATAFSSIVDEQKEAEGLGATEEFYQDLQVENTMRLQGVSASKIADFRTKADRKAAAYLSAEDRVKFRKKVEGLGFTGTLAEKTAEQLQYEGIQQVAAENNLDMSLPNAQFAAEKLYDLKVNGARDLQDLTQKAMPGIRQSATQVYLNPELSLTEKNLAIEKMITDTTITAQRMAGGQVPMSEVNASIKPAIDELNTLKSYLTSDYQKGVIELNKAQNAAVAFESLPTRTQNAINIMQAAGQNAAPFLTSLGGVIANDAMKVVEGGQGDPSLKYSSDPDNLSGAVSLLQGTAVDASSKAGKAATELVNKGAKAVVKEESDPAVLGDSVDKVIKGASYQIEEMSPADAEVLVKSLAGDTGELIKRGDSGVKPENLAKFQEGLQSHMVFNVAPAINNAINSSGMTDNGIGIKMQVVGDRVVFVSDFDEDQRAVLNLNRALGSDLTTYAKAMANVSGGTIQEAVTSMTGLVLPNPNPKEKAPEIDQGEVSQGVGVVADEVLQEDPLDIPTIQAKGTPYEEEVTEVTEAIKSAKSGSVKRLLENRLRLLGEEVNKAKSGLSSDSSSDGGDTGKAVSSVPKQASLDSFKEETLKKFEGYGGDDVTGIETLKGGLTKIASDQVGGDWERAKNEPEYAQELAEKYFDMSVSPVKDLPTGIQAAYADMVFNGGSVGAKMNKALEVYRESPTKSNYQKVLTETLDTATVAGKSSKGLALRRANAYNYAFGERVITEVEQLKDGTIKYWGGEELIAEFTAKKGKHPTSATGKEML